MSVGAREEASLTQEVVSRIISRDMYLSATVSGVVFENTVEYYSGPVGGGPKHTAPASVVSRWASDSDRSIRVVGVSPSVYLQIEPEELSDTITVDMSYEDLLKFGSFAGTGSDFRLTVDTVDVKVTTDKITFAEFGSFERAGSTDELTKYESVSCRSVQYGSDTYYANRCREEILSNLREVWARSNEIYASEFRIDTVTQYDYSSRIRLEVTHENIDDVLKFTIGDSKSDSKIVEEFIESVGFGLVENLEGETVWVTLDEYSNSESVSESGAWKLYCPSDRPSILYRAFDKVL